MPEGPVAVAHPGEEGGHRHGDGLGLHMGVVHGTGDQPEEDGRIDEERHTPDDAELRNFSPQLQREVTQGGVQTGDHRSGRLQETGQDTSSHFTAFWIDDP